MGWRGWGAIAYMMICVSMIGYGIWYYLVPRYDVNQTMPFTLLVPMFGVASGALILDERMTWLMLAGSALTLVGVALEEAAGHRRPRPGGLVEPAVDGDRAGGWHGRDRPTVVGPHCTDVEEQRGAQEREPVGGTIS